MTYPIENRLRTELRAIDSDNTEVIAPPVPAPKLPCLDCHLRNVCKVQELACDALAQFLKGEPIEGPRRPTGAMWRRLQAKGGKR